MDTPTLAIEIIASLAITICVISITITLVSINDYLKQMRFQQNKERKGVKPYEKWTCPKCKHENEFYDIKCKKCKYDMSKSLL